MTEHRIGRLSDWGAAGRMERFGVNETQGPSRSLAAAAEFNRFYRCPGCGAQVDKREVAEVRRHHDHVLHPRWFGETASTLFLRARHQAQGHSDGYERARS